ncbi:MAG: hypothetical protein KAT62_11495 [Desulfuromonadales bacterium]|nr:hypothetical protein [Desulfuromonadales bacterium]
MRAKSSKEMTPSEWLTSIREKYKLNGNLSFQDSWLEDLLSRLPASNRDAARKIWIERRSKKASHVLDEMMEQYLQQVFPILSPNEKIAAETTFFGVLPTYQFNAYTGFTPRGDRIVILHHALVYTLSYWSHWYLRMKDEGGKDYLRENPRRLIEALLYIVSIWLEQPLNVALPDIYPKTEDSWQLDECLVFSAISFVIGHELGHIICGHSHYGSDQDKNHMMEFEADQIGLSIAIRHTLVKTSVVKGDTYHTKFMLFGPLFALTVMSLFGDQSSHTHPSPSDRQTKLLLVFRGELQKILGARLSDFLDDVEDNVFDVLDNNSSRLFELFAIYHELISDLKLGIKQADAPYLREELTNFWS